MNWEWDETSDDDRYIVISREQTESLKQWTLLPR